MALEIAERRAWDGRAWWSQGVLLEEASVGAPAPQTAGRQPGIQRTGGGRELSCDYKIISSL